MQQDGFLVGNDFAEQLALLHAFDDCPVVDVEVGSVGELGLVVLAELLKLVIRDARITNCNAALALPPMLRLYTALALDALYPLAVQTKLKEAFEQADSQTIVASSVLEIFQKNVSDEGNAAA